MNSFTPILRTASALLLATLVAACGGGGFKGGDEAATQGDVLVRVVDARQSTTPIANASVTVTAGSATRTGTSAADGTIRFSNLPIGSASVQVTRDLFLPFTGTVTVQGASLASLSAPLQRRSGQVTATVTEARFGDPVPNARVETTFEGFTIFGTTNATGTVTLTGVPTGSVPIGTSAEGFLAEPPQTVALAEGGTATVSFQLDRRTEPGGGYTPPTDPPPPTNSGQTLVLHLNLVVVDQNGVPVNNLTGADFTLRACTPVAGEPSECVRKPASATFDAPYTPNPASGAPGSFASDDPSGTPLPYAASMLLDQSNSIITSDPSDARVYASKVFLDTVVAGDQVALGAFAQGSGRLIPTQPLSIFAEFDDARSIFDDALDSLPDLEGGFTPLYSALDGMVAYTAANAPGGARRAVVVFTDGRDTICTTETCRRTERSETIVGANASNVDIFTVGLGSSVDVAALTELSYRTGGIHLVASTPEQMIAIMGALGNLLSGNVTTYRLTWTIQANAPNVFQSGDAVLGTIDVRVGTQTIVLPFYYTVPATPI